MVLPEPGTWTVVADGAESLSVKVDPGPGGQCGNGGQECRRDCDCDTGEVCLRAIGLGGPFTSCVIACELDRDCGGDGVCVDVADGLDRACVIGDECNRAATRPARTASRATSTSESCTPGFSLDQEARGPCSCDSDCADGAALRARRRGGRGPLPGGLPDRRSLVRGRPLLRPRRTGRGRTGQHRLGLRIGGRVTARRVAATLSLLLAAACGDGGGSGDDHDGGTGADGGPATDGGDDGCQPTPCEITCEGLDGAWVFENLSKTADTISNEGDLAIGAAGAMMVAFSEPLPDPVFDQDIFTAGSGACAWDGSAALTKDSDVQNAYPSLAVEGDTFHLVWSGYPEGLNQIYYAANSGSGWSDRVNLTGEFDGAENRHAYAPSISIGPGGAIAIAYLSAPASETGGFAGPSEVRVARLEADTLAGPPKTVIPAGDDGCFNPRAAHDGDGNLHVLAECGPLFDQDIIWATDAGAGPWRSEPMPGTAGHDDLSSRSRWRTATSTPPGSPIWRAATGPAGRCSTASSRETAGPARRPRHRAAPRPTTRRASRSRRTAPSTWRSGATTPTPRLTST